MSNGPELPTCFLGHRRLRSKFFRWCGYWKPSNGLVDHFSQGSTRSSGQNVSLRFQQHLHLGQKRLILATAATGNRRNDRFSGQTAGNEINIESSVKCSAFREAGQLARSKLI